jgi:hypothetical protein
MHLRQNPVELNLSPSPPPNLMALCEALAIFSSTLSHQNVTMRMYEFVWLQHWQHLIRDLVYVIAGLIMYECFKLCTILCYITHALHFAHNDIRKYFNVVSYYFICEMCEKTYLKHIYY